MILFLDTEFTDFTDCELLSIGLVSEDDRHAFYAERTDVNLARCNAFVVDLILPKLGLVLPSHEQAAGGRLTRPELALALRDWLERIHAIDGQPVLVLFDYQTDFDLLVDALDNELPPWIDGYNISGIVGVVGCVDDKCAHHALFDACALRADWRASR